MFLTDTKTKTHLSIAAFQKTLTTVFLVTTGLFITGLLFMAGYSALYDGRVMPNTYAGSLLLGGKEVNAVSSNVVTATYDFESENGLALSYNGQKYYPSLVDLGVNIDVDQTVQQAVLYGREGETHDKFLAMVNSALGSKEIPLEASIDQDKLSDYIKDNLSYLEIPEQDAYIDFDSGVPRAVAAKNGQKIDVEQLSSDIIKAVASLATTTIPLKIATAYPEIDYDQAASLAGVAREIIARPLILNYQDFSYRIEGPEISTWLISLKDPETNKLVLSIQESALSSSLDRIGQDFENKPQNKIIIASKENTTVIQEGADGKIINRSQALEDVASALFEDEGRQVELALVNAAPSEEHEYVPAAPSNEGKVIAVNLTRQRAYAFENRELIYATKVSTGRAGYGTPPGKFYIYGKDRAAKMSGPGYYLPGVPFIMWYSGDYSLHGTYWHDNFGHPMSHGCSNFPTPMAELFFNWAPLRTPVYIANEIDGQLVY